MIYELNETYATIETQSPAYWATQEEADEANKLRTATGEEQVVAGWNNLTSIAGLLGHDLNIDRGTHNDSYFTNYDNATLIEKYLLASAKVSGAQNTFAIDNFIFTFNNREMMVFENYAVSRYRPTLYYYFIITMTLFVFLNIAYGQSLVHSYGECRDLGKQLTHMAALDNQLTKEEIEEQRKRVKSKKSRRQVIISAVFDDPVPNDSAPTFSTSYVYGMHRCSYIVFCCSCCWRSLKRQQYKYYSDVLEMEIKSQVGRIQSQRQYEMIASHLLSKKSDQSLLIGETVKHLETIQWDAKQPIIRKR